MYIFSSNFKQSIIHNEKTITSLLLGLAVMLVSTMSFEVEASPPFKDVSIQKENSKVNQSSVVVSFDCIEVEMAQINFQTDSRCYSEKENISQLVVREQSSDLITINPDFKVGWDMKGSLLTNYITKYSIRFQNNQAVETVNYTDADFKVGWQKESTKIIYKEKTPGLA